MLPAITASERTACHSRVGQSLPFVLALALTVIWPSLAAEWHAALYLDGGGWWRSRIGVRAHNEKDVAVAGEPATIPIGSGPGKAQLAGQIAQSLRVCDAAGREMLFALHGPDGAALAAGPIPEGSALLIPVECPPKGTAEYFVYFDNPAALAVPDFLETRIGVVNGSVEQGHGETPEGWAHDPADAAHRASWSLENPRSGKRCLKTVVVAGAEPTWISTRQRDIPIRGGARYRMTAWVKAENVQGQVGWYIHLGHRQQPMLASPMLLVDGGTFDWRPVTAEFVAPAEADLADLGTVLRGTGTAWFDDVALTCLTAGSVRVELLNAETIQLREVGDIAATNDLESQARADRAQRVPVDVVQFASGGPRSTLVAVDWGRLEARRRGRIARNSVSVTLAGGSVQHQFLGDLLLFRATLEPMTRHHFHVHFSDDPKSCRAPVTVAADSPVDTANRARNPGFESGTETPEGWTGSGAGRESPGVVLGFDTPGREGFGRRCAKLHAPAETPKGWRGWRQDVPVEPGRTYLVAAWVKCRDVRAGEVRVHIHRRQADGQLSAHEPFLSIGPGMAGTADWTLLSGRITAPSDTRFLQVHLTMEQSGTVWHDGVVVAEIVAGRLRSVEGHTAAAPRVWQVPAIVKVFPDDLAREDPSPIAIACARNEREPLQLAVRSGTAARGVRIEVDRPVGPQGLRLDDVTVNVVGHVPIDYPTNYYESHLPAWYRKIPTAPSSCDGWPGLWPDPLLPQASFDLLAGQTQPLWITVRVPQNAPAGPYRGRLRLVAGGKSLAEMPFGVQVWNFTLPDENHLAAIYDVRFGPDRGVWGKPLDAMYPEIIRFMAARRLCPDAIHPAPVFRREQGRVTADFTAYDRAAAVYFDELKFPHSYTPWDFYLFGWGHPPKPVFGEQPYAGKPPFDSADRSRLRPEYKRAYQDMLRVFWNHLKEKGWDKRVVLYISDEPFDHEKHIHTQMKALCDMIHEVDPAIPIYCSTWKHVAGWDGYLNVWGIGHDGRVPTDLMAKLRAGGARLWFTTDGQMCTDTPYCAVERLLPHYCFRYGAEAYEFWGVAWHTYNPFRFGWHSFIHQSSEPGKSTWVRYPNGDGFLLYPGAALGQAGVVSSIRCEQACEGVEDFEYLYLLRERIARAKAAGRDVTAAERTLGDTRSLVTIPNAGGRFSSKILPDPEAVYRVRRQVAAAIESLDLGGR
jgi:hypothetical protein